MLTPQKIKRLNTTKCQYGIPITCSSAELALQCFHPSEIRVDLSDWIDSPEIACFMLFMLVLYNNDEIRLCAMNCTSEEYVFVSSWLNPLNKTAVDVAILFAQRCRFACASFQTPCVDSKIRLFISECVQMEARPWCGTHLNVPELYIFSMIVLMYVRCQGNFRKNWWSSNTALDLWQLCWRHSLFWFGFRQHNSVVWKINCGSKCAQHNISLRPYCSSTGMSVISPIFHFAYLMNCFNALNVCDFLFSIVSLINLVYVTTARFPFKLFVSLLSTENLTDTIKDKFDQPSVIFGGWYPTFYGYSLLICKWRWLYIHITCARVHILRCSQMNRNDQKSHGSNDM